MLLGFTGHLSPTLLNSHPDHIFLFGDNTQGYGMAGQAIIRDRPNAFGIPTKHRPDMRHDAFFYDGDDVARRFLETKMNMALAMSKSMPVVVPLMYRMVSLGTGLAELHLRAPLLHMLLNKNLQPEGEFKPNV